MKCLLEPLADCNIKQTGPNDCLACIFAGNFALAAQFGQHLRKTRMTFEEAMILASQLDFLIKSMDRYKKWFELYQPEFYTKLSAEYAKKIEEAERKMKEVLTGEGKSYRW